MVMAAKHSSFSHSCTILLKTLSFHLSILVLPPSVGASEIFLVDSGTRSRENKSHTGALKASGFGENPAQNFSDLLLFRVCKPRSFVFLFLLSH